MLSLLKIKNIALIDELELEFGHGLNLLTGETGSGKSIIVDSLGALTGERVSSDLIKEGQDAARIEGLFSVDADQALKTVLDEGGFDLDEADEIELIVRRDLSQSGKNRIFVNGQLVTQNFLKKLGAYLVDIHGQGEQAALFDVPIHLEMLDDYAKTRDLRKLIADAHHRWAVTKTELGMLEKNEAEKLQLLDILKFQVDEIKKAGLRPGEDEELDEEKRRLNNVEKLSALSEDAYSLLYENEESTVATLEKAARKVEELGEYESHFRDYQESDTTAQAVLEDLAIAVRDFRGHLEFSPERLEEIESRLAEISRLKRKYGDTIHAVLTHLSDCEQRLENLETAEFREEELQKKLTQLRAEYIKGANDLHQRRVAAAAKFEKEVETNLKAVALEKARFKVNIDAPSEADLNDPNFVQGFTAKGFDRVEFYFSANPGESPKPLAKIASGGEASRLMLILKTTAKPKGGEKSAVFDEIDVGIGGRVAEAVGIKLKELSRTQQVLCVTHQPQIASLADNHFVVSKTVQKNKTTITVAELDAAERVEEIARMLAGEKITDAARENARAMLGAAV
ncbi:MAG TPA: DNA repair protein RecN [Pyrinomonadaceae bacterium]|nr:DNA repair protein RecN [Pyrinomonadaceae bacterium]